MSAEYVRYEEGEKQRRRIRNASIDLAITYHATGRTPAGMTIGDHIDSIESNALHQTDNAARTGMLWVHAAALTAQALEQVNERFKGEAP